MDDETKSEPEPLDPAAEPESAREMGELVAVPQLSPDGRAEKIIRDHVLWAMGAGLVPIPLADIAGVTAIQMDALKKLAELHGVPFTEDTGKRFVAALAGGVAASMGASLIKAIPGVGSFIGGVSMSAMSGASTYAICQVADEHFRTNGDFLKMDWDEAKEAYKKALEKGKEVVKSLKASAKGSATSQESEAEGDASPPVDSVVNEATEKPN